MLEATHQQIGECKNGGNKKTKAHQIIKKNKHFLLSDTHREWKMVHKQGQNSNQNKFKNLSLTFLVLQP